MFEDPFLLPNITPEMCIPISVVAAQPQIKSLTTDLEAVAQAVRASKILKLKGELIQTYFKKPQRNVIILRDVPSATTLEVPDNFDENSPCLC